MNKCKDDETAIAIESALQGLIEEVSFLLGREDEEELEDFLEELEDFLDWDDFNFSLRFRSLDSFSLYNTFTISTIFLK